MCLRSYETMWHSCHAVPPACKPGPVFRCKTTHSQHTARIEMLPQIPHLCTNPSIQDHTYTTRGRIHAIARARWVPSPHFLDKSRVFAVHPVIGTNGPEGDASPLNKIGTGHGDARPQPVFGEASRKGGLTVPLLPSHFPVVVFGAEGPECIGFFGKRTAEPGIALNLNRRGSVHSCQVPCEAS